MSSDSCGVLMHELKIVITDIGMKKELKDTYVMMYTIPRIDEHIEIRNNDVKGLFHVHMVLYDNVGRFEDHSHGFVIYVREVEK